MGIFLSSGLPWVWQRSFTIPNCLTAGRLSATKQDIFPWSSPYSLQFVGLFYGGCRTQWPRGLRRESAAARFLGSRDRMPQRHGCLSLVIVEGCQVEVSAWGWSLIQRSPTECGVSVILKPRLWGGPGPMGAVEPWERNFSRLNVLKTYASTLIISCSLLCSKYHSRCRQASEE